MARASSTVAPDRSGERTFAGLAVVLWVMAVLAFGVGLLVFAAPYRRVFTSLGTHVSGLTTLLLDGSAWLRSPVGVLVALGFLALTITPYLRGARGPVASRRYLWAAVAVFVLALGAYFAVQLPVQHLVEELGTAPAR